MTQNKKRNVFALTGKVNPGALAASDAVKAVTPQKADPMAAGTLMKALEDRAHNKGDSKQQMAEAFGVTYGYVMQLEKGIREVNAISDHFATACAEYLGIPRLQVLTMAGRVMPEDYFTSVDVYQQEVERALRFIEADAAWSQVLTPTLRACDAGTLFGVVRLYEAATGTVLMPGRHSVVPAAPGEL